jgi:hypothetical protein
MGVLSWPHFHRILSRPHFHRLPYSLVGVGTGAYVTTSLSHHLTVKEATVASAVSNNPNQSIYITTFQHTVRADRRDLISNKISNKITKQRNDGYRNKGHILRLTAPLVPYLGCGA